MSAVTCKRQINAQRLQEATQQIRQLQQHLQQCLLYSEAPLSNGQRCALPITVSTCVCVCVCGLNTLSEVDWRLSLSVGRKIFITLLQPLQHHHHQHHQLQQHHHPPLITAHCAACLTLPPRYEYPL